MIKNIALIATLIIACTLATAQDLTPRSTTAATYAEGAKKEQIRWTTINNAAQLQNNNKLFFIDFYTSWCGWCKKMDQEVFTDATVVKIINKYYVPIKFNAEGNSEFVWRGTRYVATPTPKGARAKVHSFAKATLGSQLGFPSFGLFDSQQNIITIIQGYQPAADLTVMLWFVASGDYKRYSFEKYQSIFEKQIRPQMEAALK